MLLPLLMSSYPSPLLPATRSSSSHEPDGDEDEEADGSCPLLPPPPSLPPLLPLPTPQPLLLLVLGTPDPRPGPKARRGPACCWLPAPSAESDGAARPLREACRSILPSSLPRVEGDATSSSAISEGDLDVRSEPPPPAARGVMATKGLPGPGVGLNGPGPGVAGAAGEVDWMVGGWGELPLLRALSLLSLLGLPERDSWSLAEGAGANRDVPSTMLCTARDAPPRMENTSMALEATLDSTRISGGMDPPPAPISAAKDPTPPGPCRALPRGLKPRATPAMTPSSGGLMILRR